MKRLLVLLAQRAHAIEAATGSALLVAGVATFSVGAALIVAGLALLIPVAWPALTRRG